MFSVKMLLLDLRCFSLILVCLGERNPNYPRQGSDDRASQAFALGLRPH
jgi:hypothetical protein